MNSYSNSIVRELTTNDISFIVDYWLKSDKEYLLKMGVDLNKLPSREQLSKMLTNQLSLPDSKKSSLAMILEIDGKPNGHCNVNEIKFEKEAKMHLHLWNTNIHQKGLGTMMVSKSIPFFFERLHLKVIYCEPFAENPAPHKTLKKVGFEFVKRYITTPGSLNFEQEVDRYKLTKERFYESFDKEFVRI